MVRTRNKKVTPLTHTHTHSKFEVNSYTLCWTISRFLFDANRLFTAFGGAHRQWWGERVWIGWRKEKKCLIFSFFFWIYTLEGEERKVRFFSLMHTYWNIKFCSGSFSSLFTRNSILFDIHFVCLRSSNFFFIIFSSCCCCCVLKKVLSLVSVVFLYLPLSSTRTRPAYTHNFLLCAEALQTSSSLSRFALRSII